jgi:hypothetical protein
MANPMYASTAMLRTMTAIAVSSMVKSRLDAMHHFLRQSSGGVDLNQAAFSVAGAVPRVLEREPVDARAVGCSPGRCSGHCRVMRAGSSCAARMKKIGRRHELDSVVKFKGLQ